MMMALAIGAAPVAAIDAAAGGSKLQVALCSNKSMTITPISRTAAAAAEMPGVRCLDGTSGNRCTAALWLLAS
jgi:hypothetical protein